MEKASIEQKAQVAQFLRADFPTENLLHKKGGGGNWLTYVTFERIWDRLSSCCPAFTWEVKSLQVQGDGKDSLWVCIGTLTIPELGSRDGVGTDKVWKGQYPSEEAAKAAATDAFKRACVLFGIGIGLYEKEEDNPDYLASKGGKNQRPRIQERPGEEPNLKPYAANGGQCPECHAPNGKHATKCPLR